MSIAARAGAYVASRSGIGREVWEKIRSKPLYERMAKGSFWAFTGTFVAKLFTVLSSILVVRMMGRESYGQLGMVESTIGTLCIFAGFGMGTTGSKHVAEYKRTDPEKAGQILGLSCLLAVTSGGAIAAGLAWVAPWVAQQTLKAPQLAPLLRIGALILWLETVNGAIRGGLSGFEAFRAIAARNLVAGIVGVPILLGSVYYGGLHGALWGLVGTSALHLVLNLVALGFEQRRFGVRWALPHFGHSCGVIWGFSLPALLANLSVGPVNWLCSAMLARRVGGYAELGIYAVANQWFNAILFIPSTLAQVILPILSERMGQKDVKLSRKLLSFSIKLNGCLILPLVLGGSLVSPWILRAYGPEYIAHWPTLVLALATAGMVAVQIPVGQFLTASGRMWTGLLMNAGWAAVFIGASGFGVRYGAMGLAGARLTAYAAHTIWVILYARHLLKTAPESPRAVVESAVLAEKGQG